MFFKDRNEAGKKLAEKIMKIHPDFVKNKNVIVLALPRGGLPVGAEISKKLHVLFDVIVTHKLGYPGNEELAIGAVSEDGSVYVDPSYSRDISKDYLEEEKGRQKAEILDRIKRYRNGLPLPELYGKTVILVDDGIATGNTMRAAIATARNKKASKIFAAVPVLPEDTLREFEEKNEAEIISIETPKIFFAIGQFYEKFEQLTDEQV